MHQCIIAPKTTIKSALYYAVQSFVPDFKKDWLSVNTSDIFSCIDA